MRSKFSYYFVLVQTKSYLSVSEFVICQIFKRRSDFQRSLKSCNNEDLYAYYGNKACGLAYETVSLLKWEDIAPLAEESRGVHSVTNEHQNVPETKKKVH